MSSGNANNDCKRIEQAKIRELNSRFADTLVDIQSTWDILSRTIDQYSENNIYPKFTNILEELNLLAHNGLVDEHVHIVKAKIKEVMDIIRFKYISSDKLDEYFESNQFDQTTVDDYKREFDTTIFHNDEYLQTQWFDTAKIFSIIADKLNLAKNTINDCIRFSDNLTIGSRIGDAIMYYITAVKLYIIKIEREIKFYETHGWTHVASWFSWMFRSGNGYNSTRKKWIEIKDEIVKDMLYTPDNMLKNFTKAYRQFEINLTRIDNRDYAIEDRINDLINVKINDELLSYRFGNIHVKGCKSIVEQINQLITGISLVHDDVFIFKSKKPFTIEKDSTLTVLLGFDDVTHTSKFDTNTECFYIAGTRILDNENLHEQILERKNGKLICIFNRLKNTFVTFGMGRHLISKYQESS